ncbi:hypothetical protein FB45DRAFT_1035592 [Roridomyces roridus]|uniref:Uncharacterized protein n=1 Tax=Roridomyces roridus TaxID=1738132 RepID=A0AAD7FC00_9AGAR|nr:hypothetical protein FB45DRAFT_1035592 [Roridomyces roridus]
MSSSPRKSSTHVVSMDWSFRALLSSETESLRLPRSYSRHMFRHPVSAKVLSNPEFTLDARIDHNSAKCVDSDSTSSGRTHTLILLEAPKGDATDGEAKKKTDSFLEGYLNARIVQKNVLKAAVFRPNVQMDAAPEHHVQAASRIAYVVQVEFEVGTLPARELLTTIAWLRQLKDDQDILDLITAAEKDFNLIVSASDKIVLHQK